MLSLFGFSFGKKQQKKDKFKFTPLDSSDFIKFADTINLDLNLWKNIAAVCDADTIQRLMHFILLIQAKIKANPEIEIHQDNAERLKELKSIFRSEYLSRPFPIFRSGQLSKQEMTQAQTRHEDVMNSISRLADIGNEIYIYTVWARLYVAKAYQHEKSLSDKRLAQLVYGLFYVPVLYVYSAEMREQIFGMTGNQLLDQVRQVGMHEKSDLHDLNEAEYPLEQDPVINSLMMENVKGDREQMASAMSLYVTLALGRAVINGVLPKPDAATIEARIGHWSKQGLYKQGVLANVKLLAETAKSLDPAEVNLEHEVETKKSFFFK